MTTVPSVKAVAGSCDDRSATSTATAAEFFAGIGLVRMGLERAGFDVIWANDIEPIKHAVYASNFDSGDEDRPEGHRKFMLGDVWSVAAATVPVVDLFTASSPCTDLSLAGGRRGLSGPESSAVWGFMELLRDVATRPRVVMLENVVGLATSHGGSDLRALIAGLNDVGYSCDVLAVDAALFIPQSRPRLFVIASRTVPPEKQSSDLIDWLRPAPVQRFLAANQDLRLHRVHLERPEPTGATLAGLVERLPSTSPKWWPSERVNKFVDSLAPLQAERLKSLKLSRKTTWRTAYRRTRNGVATWEIRRDEIAGCLRTARGGSSRQALVQAGRGELRVRWMTSREYARLMGAGELDLDAVTENQALFGLGDAVCVPVIEWIAQSYLMPLITGVWAGEQLPSAAAG